VTSLSRLSQYQIEWKRVQQFSNCFTPTDGQTVETSDFNSGSAELLMSPRISEPAAYSTLLVQPVADHFYNWPILALTRTLAYSIRLLAPFYISPSTSPHRVQWINFISHRYSNVLSTCLHHRVVLFSTQYFLTCPLISSFYLLLLHSS
jgi:hypothetical protein